MSQVARILLIEDNQPDIVLFQEAFKEAEVEVKTTVFEDAIQASQFIAEYAESKRASSEAFHLIIIDLNLPKKSGLELLQEIRAKVCFQKTPVVMVSSSNSPVDKAKALELGAQAFYPKPLLFNSFLQMAKDTLNYLHPVTSENS